MLPFFMRCSVDSILMGGEDCIAYPRHVTVEQMRKAVSNLAQLGELLGQDHFIYQCVNEALNHRMNTTIEQAFADPHIFEVLVIECMLGCIRSGDYVDPRDVQMHLAPSRARDLLLNRLREKGIR